MDVVPTEGLTDLQLESHTRKVCFFTSTFHNPINHRMLSAASLRSFSKETRKCQRRVSVKIKFSMASPWKPNRIPHTVKNLFFFLCLSSLTLFTARTLIQAFLHYQKKFRELVFKFIQVFGVFFWQRVFVLNVLTCKIFKLIKWHTGAYRRATLNQEELWK